LELGADYVCAGHIFETDCKKGVPPRGLSFLRDICAQSPVPVYAIGGIREENENKAIEQGAAGVCVMSGAMKGKSK
jgi:thiamine-phosphate pyrophosphorylase